ncbi:MAG: hypothetical protein V2A79_17935, partial [Planctomycetota bacterium]
GIAAHLVLLLALLRCARSAGQISPPTVPARPDQMSTWHPVAFYVLSLLVLLSMFVFVVVGV